MKHHEAECQIVWAPSQQVPGKSMDYRTDRKACLLACPLTLGSFSFMTSSAMLALSRHEPDIRLVAFPVKRYVERARFRAEGTMVSRTPEHYSGDYVNMCTHSQ